MGVHTSGQLATVDRVTLEVDNVSGAPLRPVSVAALAGSFSVPWVELSGPAVIAPHSSARVELGAPNFPAEPSASGGSKSLHSLVTRWLRVRSRSLGCCISHSSRTQ